MEYYLQNTSFSVITIELTSPICKTPAEFVTNDPTVKKFVEELNIPLETVNDVIGSAVSIKVNGIKPIKFS